VSEKRGKEPFDLTQYAERGLRDGFATFNLRVRIVVSPDGPMWSTHEFETPEDATLAEGVASQGTRQVAHALLTEALRRELYLCALAEMTKDIDFLQVFADGDEEKKKRVAISLATSARKSLMGTTGKIGVGYAFEILEMLVEQTTAFPSVDDLSGE